MPIRVGCPSCETSLKLADSLAGKAIKCPKCASIVRVPEAAEGLEANPCLSLEDDVPAHLRERIARKLARGEQLFWVGQPSGWLVYLRVLPSVLFYFLLAPILIVVAVYAFGSLLTPGGARGSNPGKIFGVGFVCSVGALYLIYLIPLSLWKAVRAGQSCYALTSRRAIVWSVEWNGRVKATSYPPERLEKTRRVDSWFGCGAGDVIFDTATVVVVRKGNYGGQWTRITHYGFLAIENVRDVERQVRETLID